MRSSARVAAVALSGAAVASCTALLGLDDKAFDSTGSVASSTGQGGAPSVAVTTASSTATSTAAASTAASSGVGGTGGAGGDGSIDAPVGDFTANDWWLAYERNGVLVIREVDTLKIVHASAVTVKGLALSLDTLAIGAGHVVEVTPAKSWGPVPVTAMGVVNGVGFVGKYICYSLSDVDAVHITDTGSMNDVTIWTGKSGFPQHLVADDKGAAWLDDSFQVLATADINKPIIVATPGAEVGQIAIDATRVYYATKAPLSEVDFAERGKLSGSTLLTADQVNAVGVDGLNVYYASCGNVPFIGRAPKDSGVPQSVVVSNVCATALAVTMQYIFYVDDTGRLFRVPKPP